MSKFIRSLALVMASLPLLSSRGEAAGTRLQIVRVPIALTSLGIYDGRIDGVSNPETKPALATFQTLKGLPETGLMTTPTLNAFGVPAVN